MFRVVAVIYFFIFKNVFTSFTGVIKPYHISIEEYIPYLCMKGAFKNHNYNQSINKTVKLQTKPNPAMF